MGQYVKTVSDLKFKRSMFDLSHRVLSSYQHGYLYPQVYEVLPGDTWSDKLATLTRMSAPIFPIMDNITRHDVAFFVPKRIIWNKTKQFYGEAEDFGIAEEIQEPYVTCKVGACGRSDTWQGSTFDHKTCWADALGLVVDASSLDVPLLSDKINILPYWAVMSVYNEYFRHQIYCPSFIWNKDAKGAQTQIATRGGSAIKGISDLPKVCKSVDVFTRVMPWAEKAEEPVGIDFPEDNLFYLTAYGDGGDDFYDVTSQFDPNGEHNYMVYDADGEDYSGFTPFFRINKENTTHQVDPDWTATLGNTGTKLFTINQLKYAIALEDYYTRLLHYGSRYGEYILGQFGVKTSAVVRQVPQFLGRITTRINVDQVIQTTGHDASASSELGQLGANSVTGKSGEFFNFSADEPGYIVVVTYFKHDRTYSSGIAQMYLKHDLFDYYQPVLGDIADLPMSVANVYWDGDNSSKSFGFNEPWFDYHHIPDRVRGMLNPSTHNSLDFITLAEAYDDEPVMGQDFVEEDRLNLARALTTGETGIDYISDTYHKISCTRIMPFHVHNNFGAM